MFKQYSIVDLVKLVQARIRAGLPGISVYDVVPDGTTAPFIYIELTGAAPANTKTMYVTQYSIAVHIITSAKRTNVPAYTYIQRVLEALTEDIAPEAPFSLLRQECTGVQATYEEEETGERHSIIGFDFFITYGFITK